MIGRPTQSSQQSTESLANALRYFNDPIAFSTEVLGIILDPPQEAALRSLSKNTRTAWISCHGAGKCLGLDEDFLLADGRYVKACDLIGRYFGVISWASDASFVPTLGYAFDNGIQPLYRINTHYGREFIRTSNHPFLTPTGWIETENLKVGDSLMFPRVFPVKGSRLLPKDEIKLLAYLIGDGGLTAGSVVFSQQPGRVLDEFRSIVAKHGAELTRRSEYDYVVVLETNRTVPLHQRIPNPVTEMMRNYGLWGKSAHDKEIPLEIFELDNEHVALFLNRLFATDGWVYCRKESYKTEIGIGSVSKRLLMGVQRLMLRFGIVGRVRQRKTGWGKERQSVSYCWEIRNKHSILIFTEKIGIYGKEAALEDCRQLCLNKSHEKTRKYRDPFVEDKIESVEFLGEMPTVGISVPGKHTFLSDVIEHNTTVAAIAVIWWVFCRPFCKVITTASVWRQLEDYLWPEIHKWLRSAKLELMGWQWRYQLDTMKLRIEKDWFATAVASDNPANIEGAHADYLLYVLDECKSIPNPTWDAVEGALTGDPDRIRVLAISTPGAEGEGRLFRIWDDAQEKKELGWVVYHTSAYDTPRVSKAWIEHQKKQWGEDNPVFISKVLGLFPKFRQDAIVPYSSIKSAQDRDVTPLSTDRPIVGVDPARFGDNQTAIAVRIGGHVLPLRYISKQDTTAVVQEVARVCSLVKAAVCFVDEVGLGAGVVDFLRKHEISSTVRIEGINAGSSPEDKEHFLRLRDELWWTMRMAFTDEELQIPSDERLEADLSALRYSYTVDGKLRVETKEEARKRGIKSPDAGDALALTFRERISGVPQWSEIEFLHLGMALRKKVV